MNRNTRAINGSASPILQINLLALVLTVQPLASQAAEPSPSYPPPKTNLIGVAYGGKLPKFDLQIPDTKSEVSQETAVKLGFSWVRDFQEGNIHNESEALVALLKMGLTPVTAAAGAVYGPFAGESAKKLDPALRVLTKAMTELQVEEAPRSQLPGLICQGSLQSVVHLTNTFPAESAFPVPTIMDQVIPPLLPHKKVALPPDTPQLDTLLLIRVVNHGLSGPDGPNSKLSYNLVVYVTAVRMTDHAQVSNFHAQYSSASRRFVDWAINDAQPFREEFQRALQSVAGAIKGQGGLQTPPSLPSTPAPINIVRVAGE